MAHKCSSFWGRPARSLTRALTRRTLIEWREWRALQRANKNAKPHEHEKVTPRDSFEGWVHRASRRADYEVLLRLYYELLLAVKQPSDAPNKWKASSYRTGLRPVRSNPFGKWARAVLKRLEQDGKHKENGKASHHENGVARYGTPNWLEKPVKYASDAELRQARDLLRALRDAFAR